MPGQQRPEQSLGYYWSAWECAGIFRAGSWPAWPPRELCLISPADVFDGMSEPLVRSGSRSRPCLAPKRSPSAEQQRARGSPQPSPGMHRAPSERKSNAELLPAQETLPMPWALMLSPVNRASPAGGVCPPHRSGLAGLWARLCGCCCQSG